MREQNYTIVRGKRTAFLLTVAIPNEDDILGPDVPLDLTAATIKLMAKLDLKDADGDAVIDISSPSGIVISDQNFDRGEATVTIPADATETLPNRTTWLDYDVQVTEPGKDPVQTQHGQISVVPAVRQGD
jgi:hypothetical protein